MTHVRSRALALVAGAALAGAALVAVGGPAEAATTYTVGNTGACGAAADFATIGQAAAAASTGDTIDVCAGTYAETVTVTTPGLTFTGAAAGVDGRGSRAASIRSIVVGVGGGAAFNLGGTADDTTIDGFVIQNTSGNAVSAFAGSSGLTFVNNIVQRNNNGVFLANPDAENPSTFTRNRFYDNNRNKSTEGGNAGSGIFICCGSADGTTITDNEFGKHTETAINFAGDGNNPSEDLLVADNSSSGDSSFVVAVNSVNAVIDNNTVRNTGAHGTGILDFGANTNLRITGNLVSATGAFTSTGISVNNFVGVPSTGTTVIANTVSGYNYLIRATGGDTGVQISRNVVKNPGLVALRVEGSVSKAVITNNKVSSAATTPGGALACEDQSTGTRTAGTANTWRSNTGGGLASTPAGICS